MIFEFYLPVLNTSEVPFTSRTEFFRFSEDVNDLASKLSDEIEKNIIINAFNPLPYSQFEFYKQRYNQIKEKYPTFSHHLEKSQLGTAINLNCSHSDTEGL